MTAGDGSGGGAPVTLHGGSIHARRRSPPRPAREHLPCPLQRLAPLRHLRRREDGEGRRRVRQVCYLVEEGTCGGAMVVVAVSGEGEEVSGVLQVCGCESGAKERYQDGTNCNACSFGKSMPHESEEKQQRAHASAGAAGRPPAPEA